MSTFRHPAFPEILHTCPDERDDEARAMGWLPLLDDHQQAIYDELVAEIESRPGEPFQLPLPE